jgi:putative N6-adenine-specific DNA methylase
VAGRRFGFERWPRFGDAERAAWKRLCDEADAQVLPRAPSPIFAFDRDPGALAALAENLAACAPPVGASITYRAADARALGPTDPPGVILTNPPYGERLGKGAGLEGFWRAFGQRLRTLDGHTAYVLVPDGPAQKWIAMRPTWSAPLMNGPLAVTLCRFELGRGGGGGRGGRRATSTPRAARSPSGRSRPR